MKESPSQSVVLVQPQFDSLIALVDLLSDTFQAPSLLVLVRLLPAECEPCPKKKSIRAR